MDYKVDTTALKTIVHKEGCSTINDVSRKMQYNSDTINKIFSNQLKPSSLFMYKFGVTFHVPLKDMGNIFFAQNLRDTQVKLSLKNKKERKNEY